MQESDRPRYWLWVTGPQNYLDENGEDASYLQPRRGFDAEGWWTCDSRTREGDLIVLYRTAPRSDIAYLAVARSDASELDEPGSDFHGRQVCTFQVLEKLERPVPFRELWTDPVLANWGAVKAKFVGSSWAVPEPMWVRLLELAGEIPARVERQARSGRRQFRLERELQRHLATRLDRWADVGWRGLELMKSEYRFVDGLRADLVFHQRTGWRRRLVVVEVKRGEIGIEAIDQVLGYRDRLDAGEAGQHLRRPQAVLVGKSITPEARRQVERTSRLRFVPVTDFDAERVAA